MRGTPIFQTVVPQLGSPSVEHEGGPSTVGSRLINGALINTDQGSEISAGFLVKNKGICQIGDEQRHPLFVLPAEGPGVHLPAAPPRPTGGPESDHLSSSLSQDGNDFELRPHKLLQLALCLPLPLPGRWGERGEESGGWWSGRGSKHVETSVQLGLNWVMSCLTRNPCFQHGP